MKRIDLRKVTDLRKIEQNQQTSGTTGGLLPKAVINDKGKKIYLKMSSYSKPFGVYGIEVIMETVFSRIGMILGFDVLEYWVINATVVVDKNVFNTIISVSNDYLEPAGTRKMPMEKAYERIGKPGESVIDFIKRIGLYSSVSNMLLFDYLIINMDRHGKNSEILLMKNQKIKLAPVYDSSLSFLTTKTEKQLKVKAMPIYDDLARVNNYIGFQNLEENLRIIRPTVKIRVLNKKDRAIIFQGIGSALTKERRDFIFNTVNRRIEWYVQNFQANRH